VNEIESVTSVWRLELVARGTPAREVRRLEDVLIVPSFPAETQAGSLQLLSFVNTRNYSNADVAIATGSIVMVAISDNG